MGKALLRVSPELLFEQFGFPEGYSVSEATTINGIVHLVVDSPHIPESLENTALPELSPILTSDCITVSKYNEEKEYYYRHRLKKLNVYGSFFIGRNEQDIVIYERKG
jgi:hypothetical protein